MKHGDYSRNFRAIIPNVIDAARDERATKIKFLESSVSVRAYHGTKELICESRGVNEISVFFPGRHERLALSPRVRVREKILKTAGIRER